MAHPPILSWENLGLQQGGRWLFGGPSQDNIDLHIGPRDRLALIGRNGVGKTTLFRLIDNRLEADQGQRKVKPGTRIVVLEQDPDVSAYETLMDFALGGENPPAEHEVEARANSRASSRRLRSPPDRISTLVSTMPGSNRNSLR